MQYLIGIIVALVGAFFWQRNRANTAEARNDNLQTKEELNKIDNVIAKNSGQEQAEEEKQAKLKKEIQENATKSIVDNVSSLIDFFNKRKG